MSDHSKEFPKEEFFNAAKAMGKYQEIHNIIRKDYEVLLDLTETAKDNKKEFDALYRASLKSLFTIIEADIFGLNNLSQYENYSDQHRFEDKFKKTFTHICKTWNKEDLKKSYLDSKYSDLKVVRKKRDELIHPKEKAHIHEATIEEFKNLKNVYKDYDDFINKLMDNFFIEVKFDIKDLLKR